MVIRLSEHNSVSIKIDEFRASEGSSGLYESVHSKRFNQNSYCYEVSKVEDSIEIKADYCIGLDWVGQTAKTLYVEPKLNTLSVKMFNVACESENGLHQDKDSATLDTKEFELDYLNMLLQVTSTSESKLEVDGLVQIDWKAKTIEINQQDDKLTPFLVVRFLQTLKTIVRKGLKKDYYRIRENMHNRIKGKILVGQNIKQNVLRNRFTATFCEYQVFGEDHVENRFLKKALLFSSSYVECNKNVFGNNLVYVEHALNYCRPSFGSVSDQVDVYELKHTTHSPFFKDYNSALQIGQHILRKFGYNITQTSVKTVHSPPFWIDMARLFELYVYSKMIEANQEDRSKIHYQFSTYGNSLDILLSKAGFKMVIDAKYKLRYQNGLYHEDIRQVAGYARLKKVRQKLSLTDEDDSNIECLIIYPDVENGLDCLTLENIVNNDFRKPIKEYFKVYKLGVKLPVI